jgi:hypothetical protein
MINAKEQIRSCVVLEDLQRIEGGFVKEALSIWDKLEGEVCSYADFMSMYVELKWKRWVNQLEWN